MTDFLVEPNSKINITDADETEIPLLSFHVIIIVEPDPERWMPVPENRGKVGFAIDQFNQGLEAELNPDSETHLNQKSIAYPPDINRCQIVWIRYTDDDNFFEEAASFCNVIFRFPTDNDTDNFKFYLDGIKISYPDWKIAVVGGMFEDDVIQIANLLAEMDFSTTVLSRQCISRNGFVNLDDLMEYQAWVDTHGMEDDDFDEDIKNNRLYP